MIKGKPNISIRMGANSSNIVLVMVVEWDKVLIVYCDPMLGHVLGLLVRIPTGGMAGLRTLVTPLINCIINQMYRC